VNILRMNGILRIEKLEGGKNLEVLKES